MNCVKPSQVEGSGQGWQDIPGSDATTTSYTVTGLNNGQSYTFQVRAVNQAGPGEASGSAAATPLALPDQPVGLRATPGANSVILDWSAASTDRDITKYQLQEEGSGQGWQDIPGSDATTTSYTVTGLNNGQSYTFQVRAVNQAGPGEASGSAAATPLALPDQPVGLRATPGVNSVILDWSAASTDRDITKYQLQEEGSGQGWQDIPGSDATTTSYTGDRPEQRPELHLPGAGGESGGTR